MSRPPKLVVVKPGAIVREAERVTIRDLESTNGTFVNDVPVTESELVAGDRVRLGTISFELIMGNEIDDAYHETLYRLATTDGLMQIANKRYFAEVLHRVVGRASDHPVSVVVVDIDRFAEFNHAKGHTAGDEVLRTVAARVQAVAREGGVVGRTGGDEISIALPRTDFEDATTFAEAVRTTLDDLPIDVSIGVAQLDSSTGDTAALLERAHARLAQDKLRGGKAVVRGDP